MNVTAINPAFSKINFQSKPKKDKIEEIFDNIPENSQKKTPEKYVSKAKAASLMAAAALSTAALAGLAVKKSCNIDLSYARRQAQYEIERLKRYHQNDIDNLNNLYRESFNQRDQLKAANKSLQEKVGNLTSANDDLKSKNTTLQKLLDEAKDKINDAFEGDLTPKDIREKLFEKLKNKINNSDYGYDIEKPPVTGLAGGSRRISDGIPLPAAGTTNRAGMIELKIPEIAPDGRFSFELPVSDEIKITKEKSKDFKPIKDRVTNIADDYSDSVQWSNDKIARDLLQNFFDGHGQTLDGVKLSFTPTAEGKYHVRIEGKSTFTPDKAIFLGKTSKRNNARAAGNYGEGLKMATLKLLKEQNAQDVKIASDNWKLTYKLADEELLDEGKALSYSLDKVEKYDGNYIEFETSDKNLLESLRKSIDRFYHSNNQDFKCPDFENDIFGLKVLPNRDRGGIYVAGQRFEFDDDFDGLRGISLFIKEKLPQNILDPSRDRTSLDSNKLVRIVQWLGKEPRMTNQEKAKVLKALEKYWDHTTSETPMDRFVEYFVNSQQFIFGNKLNIKFPDKYVAYSNATNDVVWDLKLKGYKVCKSDFGHIGMPTIRDLLGDARAHDVVIPNDVEKKKILILREAIQKLSPALKEKHFTPEELDTKIFMFDNTAAKEARMYSDTRAEAITDKGVSKGFWIDKNYLNSSDFAEVLETALHELSHKAGGDESSSFSYKLTNVNRDTIRQILDDAQTRSELNALKSLWDSLSKQA